MKSELFAKILSVVAEMVGVLYASLVPIPEEEPNAVGDTSDIE